MDPGVGTCPARIDARCDAREKLVVAALESPDRVVPFNVAAALLDVPPGRVVSVLVRAIAAGDIRGRIDAESAQLVIDGTAPPQPTKALRRAAAQGLQRLEAALTDELEQGKARKRGHSP